MSLSNCSNLIFLENEIKDHLLKELENILNNSTPSKSLKDFNLPLPSASLTSIFSNRLIIEESCYNVLYLYNKQLEMSSKLNEQQRKIFDSLCHDIDNGKQLLMFVYGHGGTGKTFLWDTILSYIRSKGKIVL